MKKQYALLLMLIIVSSCRSFTVADEIKIKNQYDYNYENLDKNYNIFINKQPINKPSDSKYDLHIVNEQYFNFPTKVGALETFSFLLSACTLVYPFTGMPLGNETVITKSQAILKSKQGNNLKTFTVYEEDTSWVAMYWGYDVQNAKNKSSLISELKAQNNVLNLVENFSIDELNKLNEIDKKNIDREKAKKKEKERQEKIKREKEKAKKIANLKKKFTDYEVEAIMSNQIYIGMSEEALIESWGKPDHINEDVGAWGVHKQYVYWGDYVYIENGKISSYSVRR